MINLEIKTAAEINIGIAKRLIAIRKRRRITQKDLALRSGVTYSSLRRFEETGDISLASLTKIAIALDLGDELDSMFSQVPFASIEEVINGQSK